MEEKTILDLIISGYYTDWFFNVFLTKLMIAIKNNLSLLLLITGLWVKIAAKTKSKWDDKASGWLMQKLTGKTSMKIFPKEEKEKK